MLPAFAMPARLPGDIRQARQDTGRRSGSHEGIPTSWIAQLSALGQTGGRPEHFGDMVRNSTPRQRRKLLRALDDVTVHWAVKLLPATCCWMLNALLVFLREDRELASKGFEDEEWIPWLDEDACSPGN